MLTKEFGQFLLSLVIFTVVALVFSVAFTPPDPFTQAVAWLSAMPVVLVGSYYLAYRLGYEWM